MVHMVSNVIADAISNVPFQVILTKDDEKWRFKSGNYKTKDLHTSDTIQILRHLKARLLTKAGWMQGSEIVSLLSDQGEAAVRITVDKNKFAGLVELKEMQD